MAKSSEYFRKFPLISYNGVPAINILKRVDFNANVRKYFQAFYDYEMQEGQRIDEIAHDLYGDVDLDWVLLQANDIIDPYYDVPLDDLSFNNLIKQKYGTIANAQRLVYAYRNNWRVDDSIIDMSAYNALPGNRKRFYEPALGAMGMTVGYVRKRNDDLISTNQIISIQFSSEQETYFAVGDTVTATSGSSVTRATVTNISSLGMTLEDIEGTWQRDTNFSVQDQDAKLTIELNASSYTKILDVIPLDLQGFYSKYNVYQYEYDVNERRRKINLVSESQVDSLNKQLNKLLK